MVSFHETKQAFSFTKYVNNGNLIKKMYWVWIYKNACLSLVDGMVKL